MKIGKPSEIQQTTDVVLRSGQTPGGSRLPGRAGDAGRPAAADEVRLTRATRTLIGETSDSAEMVGAEKIEEVRKAIEEGRFPVNADVVAQRMISEAAQLLETLSQGK
ncbi:MAG: flagellar biosynthesis anti-sigma factor FlgM [Burkholderiaceae bacterium]|nr:flagellar biosynthesis anti-sigma factor FlgM [Burkholderiaceae bacterium]